MENPAEKGGAPLVGRYCRFGGRTAISSPEPRREHENLTMAQARPSVSFIGFGEAGQAIAAGLREEGVERIAAWDILFPRQAGERLRHAAAASGVHCATSAADAVRGADLIVSAVTAASSGDAVASIVPHLAGRPYVLDINSVSPGRKQETAKLLGEAARYLDVAVIAPIHPARHKTPMLIAGADADAIAPILAGLGMRASIAGREIGAAAAIKMVRSVMIKGIEALTLECFLAAARAGVIDEVATSMKNNYPGLDWAKVVPYNIERMASHGERRAAEMEEVAETLRELGVEPLMTNATVNRQREMGQIGSRQSVRNVLGADRAAMLGAISAAARDRN
jgi:3-hydroxyisobutyrate dehydrogenase-like beta-hydroxyacid dehydrogenase